MKKKSTLKLESDLLNVSEPYSVMVGDDVRNIDSKSPHYHATGRVVGVDYEGNIKYQVTNWGATYKPGDVLDTVLNSIIRITTNTPVPREMA